MKYIYICKGSRSPSAELSQPNYKSQTLQRQMRGGKRTESTSSSLGGIYEEVPYQNE